MRRLPSSAGPTAAPSGAAVGDDQLHIGRFHGAPNLGSGLAVDAAQARGGMNGRGRAGEDTSQTVGLRSR